MSVVQARRSLERADVAILVLDAVEGLREMDATIGGLRPGGRARASSSPSTSGTCADERGLKQKAFEEEVARRPEVPGLGARSSSSRRKTGAGPDRAARGGRAGPTRPSRQRVTTGPAQPRAGRGGAEPRPRRRPRATSRSRSSSRTQIGVAAADLRPLPEPPGGPALLLQALPGEPDPGGVRVRGHPHRPQGAHPAALIALAVFS